jgi:hypothetical protein
MSFIDREFAPVDAASRSDRRTRLLRASMSALGRSPQEILVRNLSPRGLGGAARGEAFAVGERVRIVLPGEIHVGGIVRWTKARSFGVEFDEPLCMDALGEGLQRAASGPATWEVQRRHRVPAQPRPSTLRSV